MKMLEDERSLVIRIKHHLDTQEKIDLAVNRMEALGLHIVSVWSYKRILEHIEYFTKRNKQHLIGSQAYLLARTIPLESTNLITKENCEQLANECLMWFGEDSLLWLQTETIMLSPPNVYNDIFFKGSPCCKSGLVINHQEGVTFGYAKGILERNGASNVILNEENYRWMKIDFDVPSLMIPIFCSTYLKDSGIDSFKVYGDRTNRNYSRKNLAEDEYLASLKVVPIKRANNYDFSGDDSSLDPRFW